MVSAILTFSFWLGGFAYLIASPMPILAKVLLAVAWFFVGRGILGWTFDLLLYPFVLVIGWFIDRRERQ